MGRRHAGRSGKRAAPADDGRRAGRHERPGRVHGARGNATQPWLLVLARREVAGVRASRRAAHPSLQDPPLREGSARVRGAPLPLRGRRERAGQARRRPRRRRLGPLARPRRRRVPRARRLVAPGRGPRAAPDARPAPARAESLRSRDGRLAPDPRRGVRELGQPLERSPPARVGRAALDLGADGLPPHLPGAGQRHGAGERAAGAHERGVASRLGARARPRGRLFRGDARGPARAPRRTASPSRAASPSD